MPMKRLAVLTVSLLLLLSGCIPNAQKQEEVIQKDDETKEIAIIPKYKLGDQYYRTILPFKPSGARGLVVSNLHTRYDIQEFETGLMRIAQRTFDPNKYLFQEGQKLDKETVRAWLNRKYTDKQLKEQNISETNNLGLNPTDDGGGDIVERNKKNPIYLAHILEHNYLLKDGDNVSLSGVVIGLALNSVHYYQKEQYGATYSETIPFAEMESEGKKIAEEVIKRLRKMDGLQDVPITIALFQQQSSTSVVPGNFFAFATSPKGKAKLDKWEKINEKYYLFPSREAEKDHLSDVTPFINFKEDVETYFPNFTAVVAKAFYYENQLHELTIDIPIQFYGKSEAIGFTQYVTGLVMKHFPAHVTVQVNITSINGAEALIVRQREADEPYVHIYH